MEISEFVSFLKEKHFSLVVKNEKLVLKGDKNKLTNDMIESIKRDNHIVSYIKNNKEQLISYILNTELGLPEKRSKNISSIYRLSGLQQGILFHALYNKTAGAFVEQLSCDLVGVDLDVFNRSWTIVLQNHSILRSSFNYDEFSIPVQCVYREILLPCEELDYRKLTRDEQNAAIKTYEQTDRIKGFDLKTPPLMRITLIWVDDNRCRMLWTYHAILLDGWSMQVLMEEFLNTYELLLNGNNVVRVTEDRYEDFIHYIESKDKAEAEEYWRNYLKGVEQSTLLPFISSTTERTKGSGHYDMLSVKLDADETSAVTQFAQKNHLTVNTIMQGVWSYLLHRYTGEKNIVYGIIVSGRPDDLPNVEQRVGIYINTLLLHSVINEEQTIPSWLQTIQADQVASRQYQNTPLQDVLRYTGVQGDLFDSLLIVENYPVSKAIALKKWRLQVENVHIKEQINYPLSIMIGVAGEISIHFNYNTEIIKTGYVKNIRNHFKHILLQIAKQDDQPLNTLKLLPAEEVEQLSMFNLTQRRYPLDKTLAVLFESQVLATPQAVAVVFEDQRLSYDELNTQSNQLAHYLIARDVKPETLVPICIERSLEMIVAIWGILKAGAAYVPVDPEYPQERINYMLEDTGARLIISNTVFRSKLTGSFSAEIIDITKDWELISREPTDNPMLSVQPSNLAYVIYTSGSTGKPKGAMNEHRGIVNRLCWAQETYKLTTNDAVLQKTSFSFDVSVWELLWPLLAGAKLVFAKPGGHKDSEYLKSVIHHQKITMVHFVPSMLDAFLTDLLPGECHNLQKVLCSGEALKLSQAELFRKKLPATELHNLYGPTEAAIDVTYWKFPQDGSPIDIIPIGKPVANTSIYILDKSNRLVPIGAIGEIYISGVQVGRGYLSRDELTSQSFIPNPFDNNYGSRLYKTGDLGRWLPDGNIEYIGRKDEQVKVRGYRIELGEIESQLAQSGLVNNAAVMASESFNGSKQLSCCVVPNPEFSPDKATAYLRSKLPEYMVPAIWVVLDSLPLTANGKIDKRALSSSAQLVRPVYAAPRNELEIKLAIAWRNLLKVEQIGIYDNFFELGGHSLLAMRMLTWIRRELHLEIEIKELFVNPTIESLAICLSQKSSDESAISIKAVNPRPEKIPLSFSQERLWFIDQLGGSVQYNLPAVLRLEGVLNVEALERAFKTVVERHEILRTVIINENGEGYQQVNSSQNWQLSRIQETNLYNPDALRSKIKGLISAAFDLSKDYMLRAQLIEIEEDNHVLVVIMHHIASDGWSMGILVSEIAEVYKSYIENSQPRLQTLPIQYADYALWQNENLQPVLSTKLDYWKTKLDGVSPLQLPVDYARRPVQGVLGDSFSFSVGADLSDSIHRLSQSKGVTPYMTLLAAFKILLHRYSGQEDICVGSPIAGRTHPEVEGLIGFFVNTLALRTEINGHSSFNQILHQVSATTLEAYGHQDVPFEKVVQAVVRERDSSRSPLFQVMFILQNAPDIPKIQLGDIALSAEPFKHDYAKFELTLSMIEVNKEFQGLVEYNKELYSLETISRMMNHFQVLLQSIVAFPDKEIAVLEMINKPEKEELLKISDGNITGQLSDNTILDFIEEQVLTRPEAVALVYELKSLTYKELNTRSNQLAHLLKERALALESLVPICMERSLEMVIGMLGIMKAGCAYVPIDPNYPDTRIHHMLEDISATLILCDSQSKEKLKSATGINLIDLGKDNKNINCQITTNPVRVTSTNSLAYVIYTSGSTGKPKGVMIEHPAVANLTQWHNQEYKVSELSRATSMAGVGFDAFGWEIWPYLSAGAVVYILNDKIRLSPSLLVGFFKNHKITHSFISTALVKDFIDSSKNIALNLNYLLTGGDKLAITDITGINYTFVNNYGPTENTVVTTNYIVPTNQYVLPIGKPITNVYICILDGLSNFSPFGVPGEIAIGGIQLARGYLNRPELTREKFIENPFSKGSRLYRTGDLGRWLPDGNIEYLGRLDNQVKIRGYRIELGEIESVLQEHASVKQAVVVARDDNQGNKNLTGYIVPASSFEKADILDYLALRLPNYMIPQFWVELESIPLTKNGKFDRNSLPEPVLSEQLLNQYVPPVTATQQKLVEIWQHLLGVDRIGTDDNFFELGGHSLLAMRLVSYIESQFLISVPIHILFQFPSISKLSKYIDVQKNSDGPSETTKYKLLDV